MTDHPKKNDPKGINPSGQGPAQPKEAPKTENKEDPGGPGADSAGRTARVTGHDLERSVRRHL